LPWIGAYTLSHRIHKNIICDRLNGFILAQDVVVEFFLPQKRLRTAIVSARRGFLQILDEGEEVAGGAEALHQRMEMVWHDAVGGYGKVVGDRLMTKFID
jgi:hypothetical protein